MTSSARAELAPVVGRGPSPAGAPATIAEPHVGMRPTSTAARTPAGKALGCLRIATRLVTAGSDPREPRARRRLRARRFYEVCARTCALHGLDVRVRGALPSGPVVMVANHLGFVDPLILGALVPCAPIAKAEVGGWPLIGRAAERLGAMFVQREDPMSGAMALRGARRALASGVVVLNFPEGTTTDGQSLAPFKRGIFGLCQRLRVLVVPVHLALPEDLTWVGDDYFLPHYLRFARRPRTEAVVTVGAPIRPSAAPTPQALAELARARILQLAQG